MKLATDLTPEEAKKLGLPDYFRNVPGAQFATPDEAPEQAQPLSAPVSAEQSKTTQAPVAVGGIIAPPPVPQTEVPNNPPQPATQPAAPVDPALAEQERARFEAEEAQQVANQKIQE